MSIITKISQGKLSLEVCADISKALPLLVNVIRDYLLTHVTIFLRLIFDPDYYCFITNSVTVLLYAPRHVIQIRKIKSSHLGS